MGQLNGRERATLQGADAVRDVVPEYGISWVGIIPVMTPSAMISDAANWPGAALTGRHSCVTGVNLGLRMREYDPISPRTSPMLGISGSSILEAQFLGGAAC